MPSLVTDLKTTFDQKGCIPMLEECVVRYNGRIARTFDALPNEDIVKEVALRVISLVISPLFYSLLGCAYLVTGTYCLLFGRVNKVDTEPSLEEQIAALRKEGLPGWQQKAITLVRQHRKEDPSKEIQRLKKVILTPDVSAQLDRAIGWVQTNQRSDMRRLQVKALMGQVLEIKSIYGETHDVFIHAQASPWIGLTYLIKALEKKLNPHGNCKHFKFLRPPGLKLEQREWKSEMYNQFRDLFYGKRQISTVQEYINSKWFVWDNDGETREHLLSADAYLYNPQTAESALYFLVNNRNIVDDPKKIISFYQTIMRHYLPDLLHHKLEELSEKVFQATHPRSDVCGNLFVICIPKEKSSEVQYRAHPFGQVCECHHKGRAEEILAKLQKGICDGNMRCTQYFQMIPQFRIYTPLLKPEATPVYLLTPHSKSVRKRMKNQIKEIVEEACI